MQIKITTLVYDSGLRILQPEIIFVWIIIIISLYIQTNMLIFIVI